MPVRESGTACFILKVCGPVSDMLREITYLEEFDVLRLRTSGVYRLDGEIETLKRLAAALKQRACRRLLIDHRRTEVITRTIDTLERPAEYEHIWGDPATVRSIRSAIVFAEINESYRFLETVIRNRGWNTRIFDDYDEALACLIGRHTGPGAAD